MPRSSLSSRNIMVVGRRTSMRLEAVMWEALEDICQRENFSVNTLCTMIDRTRKGGSLTAAIRVYLLGYFRAAANESGHAAAGHGTMPASPVLAREPKSKVGASTTLRRKVG